jgi:hypothetical protein
MTATLASMPILPILPALPILPVLRCDRAGAISLHSRQEHGDAR